MTKLRVSFHPGATQGAFNNFQTAQADDPICSQVIEYCHSTWPNKHRISLSLHPYWEARCQISVVDDLLLYGSRIVVPASLHISTIEKIQHGHLGIQKCLSRAQNSVWWPGCTQQIKHAVENCKQCAALSTNRREPLISSTLPQFPWQVRGWSRYISVEGRLLSVGCRLLLSLSGGDQTIFYDFLSSYYFSQVCVLSSWDSRNTKQ